MASVTSLAQRRQYAGLSQLECRDLEVERDLKEVGGEKLVDSALRQLGIERQYERHERSFWLKHPDTEMWQWVTVCPDFYLPACDLFLEATHKSCVGPRRRRIQALMALGQHVILLDTPRLTEIERNWRWLGSLIDVVVAQVRLVSDTQEAEVRTQLQSSLAQMLSPFTPPAQPKKVPARLAS